MAPARRARNSNEHGQFLLAEKRRKLCAKVGTASPQLFCQSTSSLGKLNIQRPAVLRVWRSSH
jgi:hypothetical protein